MLPAEMRNEEYARLREILAAEQPKRTLEIGLANAGSALVICEHHAANGGSHVAVDPYQSSPQGWSGKGKERLQAAGHSERFELIESPDYLALPRLVGDGAQFDLILIDGWHSFDYTLIDFFFADLLLRDGGVLLIHDSGWPAVYKVCRFIETHKPYSLLSPPPAEMLTSTWRRASRRAAEVLGGSTRKDAARRRREEWFSLVAYRKVATRIVGDDFHREF